MARTPKSVRALLDALNTTSYATWAKTIGALRGRPNRELDLDITEFDLLMLLRPYMWWRHQPGFVDVYATCEAAMPVILAHSAEFGERGRIVGMFLATYLDDGKHDRRGDEMETHVLAKGWAKKLRGAEAKAMRALSALMYDIYSNKHTAYEVLRHVGWQHPAPLGKLIHAWPPSDQTFLLHALDGHRTERAVKKFYKDFIARTPYPALVEEARRYAGLLDE